MFERIRPHNPHLRLEDFADDDSLEIVRVVPTMGHTGGNHCEVRYNDVRVPKENLLGKPGGHTRPPMMDFTEEQRDQLRVILRDIGLLDAADRPVAAQ